MTCPTCGTIGVERLSLVEGIWMQRWKVLSAFAAVSAAIVGQSHLVGEPWVHILSVGGTISGALVAWNIKQHPVKETP